MHGLNFDSANRNHVFIYKHSIKLPLVEGCLGYPRPYNWASVSKAGISLIFYTYLPSAKFHGRWITLSSLMYTLSMIFI